MRRRGRPALEQAVRRRPQRHEPERKRPMSIDNTPASKNSTSVGRRDFLGALGVTVGGAGLAGAGLVAGPKLVGAAPAAPKAAQAAPKGRIPDTPFKTGHMTFLTSAAAVLG